MQLEDLVAPDAVIASLKASSAKQALQELGRRSADAYGLECREVTEGLLARALEDFTRRAHQAGSGVEPLDDDEE